MQQMENLELELIQSQLETQEYSFNNINRELHDNIGQLLSSTKLLLGIAAMELEKIPDTLKTAEHTISKAIQDLRLLSKSISKEWLHNFNLIEHIEAEKEKINAEKNVEIKFICPHENLPLEPQVQVMMFRVIHQAIQNGIKHTAAKNIIIQIKNNDKKIEVSIEDDGHSFNAVPAKENHELHRMEHRTQLLGGTLEWNFDLQKGTTVIISIPVNQIED